MNDRIKQIQAALGMSQKDFSEAIGITPGALSNIYSNRTNATSNHVRGIHAAFPQIDINWLMFGEGEMYLPTSGSDSSSVDQNSGQTAPPDGVIMPNQGATMAVQGGAMAAQGAAMHGQGNVMQAMQGGMSSGYEASLFDEAPMRQDDLLPFQNPRGNMHQKRGMQQDSNQHQKQASVLPKNFDLPKRQVKEIRVYFDDGTYEIFVPGK